MCVFTNNLNTVKWLNCIKEELSLMHGLASDTKNKKHKMALWFQTNFHNMKERMSKRWWCYSKKTRMNWIRRSKSFLNLWFYIIKKYFFRCLRFVFMSHTFLRNGFWDHKKLSYKICHMFIEFMYFYRRIFYKSKVKAYLKYTPYNCLKDSIFDFFFNWTKTFFYKGYTHLL